MNLESVTEDQLIIAIGEYIKNKPVTNDDSFNVTLIKSGDMSGFRFSQIETPTIQELLDLISSL